MLVEDYPGVGKTALARALARSIDCQFARVQCTSDLLPADVVGTNVYDQREQRFEFRPGPVFANVVLVDEINRASPKTQSGLLECMQERRVTVDVHTHELARPFLVLATQNPIEYEGTYPLPEAQVDRFMVRLSLGYPDRSAEAGMLADHEAGDRVLALRPVATAAEVLAAQDAAARVRAADAAARLRRRAAVAHARGPARRARGQPARRADAAARRQGARDDGRARPRAARRRAGARRAGARPSSDARPGDAAGGRAGRDPGRRGQHPGAVAMTRPRMLARRAIAVALSGCALVLIGVRVRRRAAVRPRCRPRADRGGRPAWVWTCVRGSDAQRRLSAERVVEEQPLEASIEVRRGPLGGWGRFEVVDPFTGSRLDLAGPLSSLRGDRQASVRVITHFSRRGMHTLRAALARRLATRSSSPAWRRESAAPAQKLLVLPRTEAVRWLSSEGARRFDQPDGDASSEAQAAVDMDGLRPYRRRHSCQPDPLAGGRPRGRA